MSNTVSGQLPLEEIYPPPPNLELGFGSRLGLVLALESNYIIAPEKNCPLVRVRTWVRVSFGVGGNFPRGQLS